MKDRNSWQDFQEQLENIPDRELIEMGYKSVKQLCNTGGKSFTMHVPPQKDDVDILFSEVLRRFESISPCI